MNCLKCNIITKNPKYCSRSCAVSINNLGITRNEFKGNLCHSCSSRIPTRQTRCAKCKNLVLTNDGSFKKESELTKIDILTFDTQRYRKIRDRARKIAKSLNLLNCCYICGYSNHVECAHIKSIQSYDDNSLLQDINNPNNLIGLCPNHHWEFDNGLLKIPEKKP